jgi:hypothetical protein
MENDKLQRKAQIISRIADAFDSETMSQDDFINAFETVITFVQESYKLTQSEIESLRSMFVEAASELKDTTNENFASTKARLMAYCEGEMSKIAKSHKEMIQKCEDKILEMKDGEDADEERVIEKVIAEFDKRDANKTEKPEETPDEVITKINKAESLIDIERINQLYDILKGLEEKISLIPRGGGTVASRSNNSTKFYPLTANGSNKVFTVPKSVASIVLMSDFPHILFEGSGFTINSTRTQITLTVENAPALGSQLLYQYSSQFN